MIKVGGKMTHTIDRLVYSQLVAKVAPKVIETEQEYQEVLGEVEKLLFKRNRTVEEEALYDLLLMLVERYEAENHAIEPPNLHSLINHLMDARGVEEADLEEVIKDTERRAKIIRGETSPTQEEASRLGKYFSVSADLFLSP